MAMHNPEMSGLSACRGGLDVEQIRKDFPVLHQEVNGRPLVFLDSAASSQTPKVVIDALCHFYERDYSNIHRGVHTLSQRATKSFEDVRVKVQRFLNAAKLSEIVFTRGTTESINLVAQTYGRMHCKEGDEIIVSAMEHHSNIVPWQLLCEETGSVLRVIPMDDDGVLDMEAYKQMLGPKTKMVGIVHVSNALGTINPVKEIIDLAHENDAVVLLDGAQSAPHIKVDMQALDCDFFAFSGHKTCGPTGVGVLYAKHHLLEEMPPYHGGGDMIVSVSFDGSVFNTPPHKFEAGTPNIAGVIGLGAALDYMEKIGLDKIAAYEDSLLQYGTKLLAALPGLRLIGTAPNKASVLSFVIDGIHPHDIGTLLDQQGVAVRTGHHCAQPVMTRFEIPATTRASLAFYNTHAELDALAAGLKKTIDIFG